MGKAKDAGSGIKNNVKQQIRKKKSKGMPGKSDPPEARA